MSKELKPEVALKHLYIQAFNSARATECYECVEKELKAIEIIKKQFRLMGNCLHARNKYAEDGWVFVKEIENHDELNAWKEMLSGLVSGEHCC